MESKQTLAKIGVFVLLGVNVGAYYYFWPRHDDGPKVVAKAVAETKGEAQLLRAKMPGPVTEPAILPASVLNAAVPLAMPGPAPVLPAPAAPARDTDTKAILALLDHIDNNKSTILAKGEGPAAPAFMPMMPSDPLMGDRKPAVDIAIASPLTAKTPPAAWLYQTDKIGTRTQLTARLRAPTSERILAEFHILCDRVEMRPQGGTVLALGHVTFTGAGWKGSCGGLTLPVHEPRLMFEEQVQVMQDILGTAQMSVVRGEKIIWELPPVTGVTQPLIPTRPGLGVPD